MLCFCLSHEKLACRYIDHRMFAAQLTIRIGPTFAGEFGVASIVTLTAWLGATIETTYGIEHINSLEGRQFMVYLVLASMGIAVALVFGLTRFLLHRSLRNWSRWDTADLMFLSLLPLFYFTYAISHEQHTTEGMIDILSRVAAVPADESTSSAGQQLGIPWRNHSLATDSKISMLLDGLVDFEASVHREYSASIFAMCLEGVILLRLVGATRIHPRIGVLVRTLGMRRHAYHVALCPSRP